MRKKPTLKSSFKKDLQVLENIYSKDVLRLVEDNIDLLLIHYKAWEQALSVFAKELEIKNSNINEIPNKLEQVLFNKVQKKLFKTNIKKIILGIAGPGAVGKETIKNALGFNTVVNTTTRKKRRNEQNGKNYHFVNEAQFKKIADKDGFVICMSRRNRGKYGIQKHDIEKILQKSQIVLIEENPVNLTSLAEYFKTHKDYKFILVYILPPAPILLHLAARLADRCQKTNDDFRSAIVSTLGVRQLNEFKSVLNTINKKIDVVFIINDDIERAVAKIKILI